MKTKLYRIAICLMFAAVTTVAQTNSSSQENASDSRSAARGGTSYIVNATTLQSGANFNVDGKGEAGVINARSHIEVAGVPMLRVYQNDASNVFLGQNAGSAAVSGSLNTVIGLRGGSSLTSGAYNTFVGADAGGSTTSGLSNVFIGSNAGASNITGSNNTVVNGYLGNSNLTYATAIGSGAVVSANNTIVLGRSDDGVIIPGSLAVNTVGGGTAALCINGFTLKVALCSSSLRYKSDVANYIGGSDVARKLRPVSFNWKDGNIADVGLVAEEVEKVDPLLVTYNAQGKLEGVKYDRIGVVLLNAFSEQQAKIKSQSDENASLREQITKMRAEIDELRIFVVCRTTMRPELCTEPGK